MSGLLYLILFIQHWHKWLAGNTVAEITSFCVEWDTKPKISQSLVLNDITMMCYLLAFLYAGSQVRDSISANVCRAVWCDTSTWNKQTAQCCQAVCTSAAHRCNLVGGDCCILCLIKPHRFAKYKMQPIATDVAWSVCVCLLVITISCAKVIEPIEMPMPFALWTRVEPRNHVLGGGSEGEGAVWGHLLPYCKYREYLSHIR